jgi:hypothetical protein
MRRVSETKEILQEAVMTARLFPEHLSKVRDAVVDHANGNGPAPERTDELLYWLFWEDRDENGAFDDFDLYFKLSQLDLSDFALQDEIAADKNAFIDDTIRLKFARDKIVNFRECCREDVFGAHCFQLSKTDCYSTFACCLTESLGQSGVHPDWFGFFPSKESFQEKLIEQGYINLEIDPSLIEDALILSNWSR